MGIFRRITHASNSSQKFVTFISYFSEELANFWNIAQVFDAIFDNKIHSFSTYILYIKSPQTAKIHRQPSKQYQAEGRRFLTF